VRIIITDANYKHSLALAKYIKKYDNSLIIVGFLEGKKPKKEYFFKLLYKKYDFLEFGDLIELLNKNNYDLVIPVGANSVEIVAKHKTEKKVLPSPKTIELTLNKFSTISLAKDLSIPVPKTIRPSSIKELREIDLEFPCVIKANLEAGGSLVEYATNKDELKSSFVRILNNKSQNGESPIVQEYIKGIGVGFFAFFQSGELKRFYIHKRIREYPLTGGPSAAAETFYHESVFKYGKRILDSLNWNGVAMVEFKYNLKNKQLHLMEINPKFWGSTELGLASGINFGKLIIESFKGNTIKRDLSQDSFKKIKFYWPLDGDLLTIIENRKFAWLLDYLKFNYYTNLNTNGIFLNLCKIRSLLKKILSKCIK